MQPSVHQIYSSRQPPSPGPGAGPSGSKPGFRSQPGLPLRALPICCPEQLPQVHTVVGWGVRGLGWPSSSALTPRCLVGQEVSVAPHSGVRAHGWGHYPVSPRPSARVTHPPIPLASTAAGGCHKRCPLDLGQDGTAHSPQEGPYASLEPELHVLAALPGRQGPECEGAVQQAAAGAATGAGPVEQGSAGQTAALPPCTQQLRIATHVCQPV